MVTYLQIAPFDIEFSVTHKELDFSHLLVCATSLFAYLCVFLDLKPDVLDYICFRYLDAYFPELFHVFTFMI